MNDKKEAIKPPNPLDHFSIFENQTKPKINLVQGHQEIKKNQRILKIIFVDF